MVIEAKPLPLIDNGATNVDIWPLENGIGLTISDADGKIFAGVFLPPTQAVSVANYIKAHANAP